MMTFMTHSEDNRTTTCTVIDGDITVTASTYCRDEDLDMCSPMVGENIAMAKAQTKLLQAYRKKMRAEYKILNDLYKSISQAKEFNKRDYTARRMRRELYILQNTIAELTELLNGNREYVKDYIDLKESFHNKLRENRNK